MFGCYLLGSLLVQQFFLGQHNCLAAFLLVAMGCLQPIVVVATTASHAGPCGQLCGEVCWVACSDLQLSVCVYCLMCVLYVLYNIGIIL